MKKFTADEIWLLRQSRGMKQKEVARKMNISIQRYSELKNNNNRPDNRTIEILAALNYTPETARKFLDNIPPPRGKNKLRYHSCIYLFVNLSVIFFVHSVVF